MDNKTTIHGTCMQMCPEAEITMRERQRLLHPMEMISVRSTATINRKLNQQPKVDRQKMVKEFCRSSAGQPMQKANALRPYNVLMDTITYLLDNALNRNEFAIHIRYDFISDRLRAVRQDIVIQNLSNLQTICLLQPIVRFYAYASYRMCEEKLQNFDSHLNNKHLQECLKRLLTLYDECDELAKRCQNGIKYSSMYEFSRPQIEAIYILFNLGNEEALFRGLRLDAVWRKSPEVAAALYISLLYKRNNYVGVCRKIKDLPDLLAAVVSLHLPVIRTMCLKIMTHSYNSKNLQYPLERLRDILCYSTGLDLLDDLKSCGIRFNLVDKTWNENEGSNSIALSNMGRSEVKKDTIEGGVVLIKGDFNESVKLIPRKEQFVSQKLEECSLQDLLFAL